MMRPPQFQTGVFQQRLIRWFEKNRRTLPWRRTRDPYRILVSEFMLQQTQVTTVLKYYPRFLRRFPTVRKLADAPRDAVMKAWEGLGYYNRAHSLHRLAQAVTREHGGRIPGDPAVLSSLPGVGRYTCGAVLSMAFGRRVPALDGNVIRVLARLFRITDNVDQADTRNRLWLLAESLLPRGRIREFNEGLMELGATVCTPKQPSCSSCPVSRACAAYAHAVQDELPIRTPRRPLPHVDVTAGVIWKNGRLLITRRPPKGLLGGLWEFPGGKRERGETLGQCLAREIREELGIRVVVGRHLVSVNHAYSHFKITLHVFHCRFLSGRVRCLSGCDAARWISVKSIGRYALPGADRKAIELLKEDAK